jgi:hypothetical protein
MSQTKKVIAYYQSARNDYKHFWFSCTSLAMHLPALPGTYLVLTLARLLQAFHLNQPLQVKGCKMGPTSKPWPASRIVALCGAGGGKSGAQSEVDPAKG